MGDYFAEPKEPNPLLSLLIDYPNNLKILHMEVEEYGATLLFHLPKQLEQLKLKIIDGLSSRHLRYLPDSLNTLCIIGDESTSTPIERLLDRLPSSLSWLELNSAFSLSASTLKSLPNNMVVLDVHGDRSVVADDYDMLPPSLTVLNLHKNFGDPGAGSAPRLPTSLTRVALPHMWNSELLASTIPNTVAALGVYPPISPSVVKKWPPFLTTLDVSHDAALASDDSIDLILNILPRTLTSLFCTYGFLGAHQTEATDLRWPPELAELRLHRAQRASVAFFGTFPDSLRCLYLGDTQYHGDHLEVLPRKLVWLHLRTPVKSDFLTDLPPCLVVLHAPLLDPRPEAFLSLPQSLLYLSCSQFLPEWRQSLPSHCVVNKYTVQ